MSAFEKHDYKKGDLNIDVERVLNNFNRKSFLFDLSSQILLKIEAEKLSGRRTKTPNKTTL